MYQPVIDKYYMVEVQLTSVGANAVIPFKDIPQLREKMRDVKTIGITAYTAAQLATSPLGLTVIAAANVTGIVVTFVTDLKEEIYRMPLIDLVSGSNSGLIRIFREKKINFPKSYITILTPGTLAVNQSVPFGIIYKAE